VRPFGAKYLAGRTPTPCARCNEHVKFGLLRRRARELGASRLATGHYARIGVDPESGGPRLRTAADAAKDQTYFLFALTGADLERTLFPVGELTKAEVRAEARALGLPVAEKPDSMEVCFVPTGDTAGFVERQAVPEALRPGAVVDEAGQEIGRHGGIHRFTVGQRRGIGVAGGARRYVKAIDAATGTVTAVAAAALGASGLVAREVTWTAGRPPAPGTPVAVRIRHRHTPMPARVVPVPPADVVIVNSCTVTDAAAAESRRLVRRARRLNPQARVVLTGCYAQTKPHEAAALEAVDHVIGLSRLDALTRAVTAGDVERVVVGGSRRAGVVSTVGGPALPGPAGAFPDAQA